jgi:hypothetical protein
MGMNKAFIKYFAIYSVIILSPFAFFFIPIASLPQLAFLTCLYMANIAGYVLFPIQRMLGLHIMTYEEFGITASKPKYGWIVLLLIVAFWLTISALLAGIHTKLAQPRRKK